MQLRNPFSCSDVNSCPVRSDSLVVACTYQSSDNSIFHLSVLFEGLTFIFGAPLMLGILNYGDRCIYDTPTSNRATDLADVFGLQLLDGSLCNNTARASGVNTLRSLEKK